MIAVRESEAFKRELKRESRALAYRSIQLVRESLAVQVACAFAFGVIALLVLLALF